MRVNLAGAPSGAATIFSKGGGGAYQDLAFPYPSDLGTGIFMPHVTPIRVRAAFAVISFLYVLQRTVISVPSFIKCQFLFVKGKTV